MLIDVNFDKPRQRFAGILWTLSPIVKDVRLLEGQTDHDKSLQFSALKITDVKPLQPENASFPIEVTELPIVTDVKPSQ